MSATSADKHGEQRPTKVVLAGVSGSVVSWRALAYAIGVARRHDAVLVCVHVCTSKTVRQEPSHSEPAKGPGENHSVELAPEMCARVKQDVSGWLARSSVIVRRGNPFAELCAVAEEVSADVIVVGKSAGLRRRVWDSVGCRLIRRVNVPVSIVP